MTLRVEFRSGLTHAKLDLLPLAGTDILAASYGLTLGQLGMFRLTVAADAVSASGLAIARHVWIYREPDELLLFKGIIEELQTKVDGNGINTVEVVGRSTGASLTWSTTLLGRQFDNATLASTVSTLLTDTLFTAGQIDSPTTNITARMDGRSIWDALAGVAEVFGLSLREDNLSTTIDVGAFGEASGITLRNLPTHSSSPYMVNIASIKKRDYALDIANKLILIAQQTGIGGSTVWFNLGDSTRTSPYTIQSDIGPDGQEYQWIEDADSIALYGERSRVLQVRDILPLGTTAVAFTRAANTLYDEGVTYLQRHKDPLVAYEVEALGLTHVDGGAYRFQVGDTFRVQFDGYVQDEDGSSRTWLSVDTDLYLMGFTRTFDVSGADKWSLTLSNILREVPNDGNITVKFMQQLHAVKAAPMPYILIGDNVVRFSEEGMQLVAQDGGNALGAPPSATRIKWMRDTFNGADIGDLVGGYFTPSTFDYNQMFLRTFPGDDGGNAMVGIWDTITEDWLSAMFVNYISSVPSIAWGTTVEAWLQLSQEDASNYALKILKNGVLTEVGGSMKSTNDGPFMLPVGPERGVYFPNSYSTWRPISNQIAPSAAPTVTSGGGGLGSVAMPATVDAGDLLLAFCSTLVNGAHTTPSGWTKLKEVATAGGGFPVTGAVFYKVADGTEDGATLNFTAGAVDACAQVYRIPTGTYTDIAVSTGTSGTVSAPNPDSVTFSGGRGLVFGACCYNNTAILTGNIYGNQTHTLTSSGGQEAGLSTDYSSNDFTTNQDPAGFSGAVSATAWVAFAVIMRAADNDVVNAATITNLFVSPNASPSYIQVELATGAPGAESSIGETKIFSGEVTPFIPIDIAAGTRLSARVSGDAAYVTLQILDQADQG